MSPYSLRNEMLSPNSILLWGWLHTHFPGLLKMLWKVLGKSFPKPEGPYHWQSPANLTCRPIYGAYRERQTGPSGKPLPDRSLIVIRPRFSFLWFKWGIQIEGVCYNCLHEIRDFSSLEILLRGLNPVMLNYQYFANGAGNVFCNEGYIRFGAIENGAYLQADGHFILPCHQRRSKYPRNVRINFRWDRIPVAEIRAKIGKKSLGGICDIRRFLKNGGEI